MYKIFLEYFRSLTAEKKKLLLINLYNEKCGSRPLPLP